MHESPINPLHRKHGACMHHEHGWLMPRLFSSVLKEHQASHSESGLFDISHLSKIRVVGNGVSGWLESLLSNRISRCLDGYGQHTLLLNDDGTIIDRLLLFRESAGKFFLLGHASLEKTIVERLRHQKPKGSIEVQNLTHTLSGLALCGPTSFRILHRVLKNRELPPPMGILRSVAMGEEIYLTHAGLADKPGYELFCPATSGIRFYEECLRSGATPCGSDTRESMRLEQARPDTALDLAQADTPVRAGLERYCDLTKHFPGSHFMHRQRNEEHPKLLVSVQCETSCSPPQKGDSVTDEIGHTVGSITSGAYSPALGRSIALAYLLTGLCRPGTRLRIIRRGQAIPATVRAPQNE